MHYIVFDLELNSKPFKNRHPNEIIEIGAVKLDESLNTLDTFQAFVKPKVYKKLFSVVKQKTKIQQKDINEAEVLRFVLPQFKQWIGQEYILCTWGHDDIHHLKMNCAFHRMSSKWVKGSINIQKEFAKIYELPAGQTHSLKNALLLLGITTEEALHRAEIDAECTAQVFRRIFDRLEVCS